MRLEFGPAWVKVSYDLTAPEALALREAGVGLKLDPRWTAISWNRQSLWNAGQPATADGPLQLDVPLTGLAGAISRRNVLWARLTAPGAAMVLVPSSAATNLRSAGTNEVVVSDYLGAGDFLGKFDRDTIERKLAAGDRLSGGFTLFLLTPEQARAMQSLAQPGQDLTWTRRVAGGVE
jgi:hypothetical protein